MADRIKYLITSYLIHSLWILLVFTIYFSISMQHFRARYIMDASYILYYYWWLILLGKLIVIMAVWRGSWESLSPKLLLLCQTILVAALSITFADRTRSVLIAILLFTILILPMTGYYALFRYYVMKRSGSRTD